MNFVQIALPAAILILSFCLKLFVDRRAKIPEFISALLEFPVDIVLLATSFIAATIIANGAHAGDGLLSFVFYIIGAVLIVVCWRRSLDLFAAKSYLLAVLISAISYMLCISGLVYAIIVVSRTAK